MLGHCAGRLALAIAILLGSMAGAAEPTSEDADFFEREVRPVLATRCQKCHGQDNNSKGGLKLTSREAVLEGGESGPAAVAGKPEASPMIDAIRYDGLEMPPTGRLTEREIVSLTSWVKRGLPWPKAVLPAPTAPQSTPSKHWAFQPVRRPDVPKVQNAAWARGEIDHFVLARLEQRGLSPSPPVDRVKLLRRATFDLTGLPPTPEEVDAFVADTSPDAFAHVVDRLLASPHYGERYGRYWLDVARYADTKGYVIFEEETYPWAYTYRDYVIRSLNQDLPYDQFIKEQLAADCLEHGNDQRSLAAMGFLTVGSHFMSNEQDIIDDRIDCVTRGLIGLTVTCARCHDHKFDPIPTRDYYSLYGVFDNCAEPVTPPLLEAPPENLPTKFYFHELARRENALAAYRTERYIGLIQTARTRVAEYLLASHSLREKPSIENFMAVVQAGDLNPTMIVRWHHYLERTAAQHDPVLAIWHAVADVPDADVGAHVRQLVADAGGTKSPGPFNRLLLERLKADPPKSREELAACYGRLLLDVDHRWQQRVAAAGGTPPTRFDDAAEEEVRQIFYAEESPTGLSMSRTGEQELFSDRESQARRDVLRKALDQWRAEGPGAPPRAMVVADRPELHDSHVFLRGNIHRQGEVVPRQFLSVLAGGDRKPFAHGSGRLDLAEAIADRRNPLTARVAVNRIWLQHFGAALVHTPSDFGTRSDPPSHPELLDYLASTFMDEGWSMKRLHRSIMLSATYQQQSDDRSECRQVDPENTLLWRMNRRRLDWEATRDSMLAVAGRLDAAVGGPSVKDIVAPGATRRTMYGYLDRLTVPGLYRTFDFPSPDATSAKRDMTTVPQQALFMMNGPLAACCASGLSDRVQTAQDGEMQEKIQRMYRICFGRAPRDAERAVAAEFLGERPAATRWQPYAHALLMSNEFVFID